MSKKINKRNRRPRNAYYIVYDLKDNIIMVDEIYNICERLDVVKSTITKALNNGSLIRRKYRIYPETDYDEDYED